MFKHVITWFAAMTWHLWRIATLRPAFARMSDSAKMGLSFALLYFAAGFARWIILAPVPVTNGYLNTVGASLLAYLVLVLIAFERPSRSSALSASVLGVSALTDLVILAACSLGFLEPSVPVSIGTFVAEAFLVSTTVRRFHQAPAVVRVSGYRLRKHPELRAAA